MFSSKVIDESCIGLFKFKPFEETIFSSFSSREKYEERKEKERIKFKLDTLRPVYGKEKNKVYLNEQRFVTNIIYCVFQVFLMFSDKDKVRRKSRKSSLPETVWSLISKEYEHFSKMEEEIKAEYWNLYKEIVKLCICKDTKFRDDLIEEDFELNEDLVKNRDDDQVMEDKNDRCDVIDFDKDLEEDLKEGESNTPILEKEEELKDLLNLSIKINQNVHEIKSIITESYVNKHPRSDFLLKDLQENRNSITRIENEVVKEKQIIEKYERNSIDFLIQSRKVDFLKKKLMRLKNCEKRTISHLERLRRCSIHSRLRYLKITKNPNHPGVKQWCPGRRKKVDFDVAEKTYELLRDLCHGQNGLEMPTDARRRNDTIPTFVTVLELYNRMKEKYHIPISYRHFLRLVTKGNKRTASGKRYQGKISVLKPVKTKASSGSEDFHYTCAKIKRIRQFICDNNLQDEVLIISRDEKAKVRTVGDAVSISTQVANIKDGTDVENVIPSLNDHDVGSHGSKHDKIIPLILLELTISENGSFRRVREECFLHSVIESCDFDVETKDTIDFIKRCKNLRKKKILWLITDSNSNERCSSFLPLSALDYMREYFKFLCALWSSYSEGHSRYNPVETSMNNYNKKLSGVRDVDRFHMKLPKSLDKKTITSGEYDILKKNHDLCIDYLSLRFSEVKCAGNPVKVISRKLPESLELFRSQDYFPKLVNSEIGFPPVELLKRLKREKKNNMSDREKSDCYSYERDVLRRSNIGRYMVQVNSKNIDNKTSTSQFIYLLSNIGFFFPPMTSSIPASLFDPAVHVFDSLEVMMEKCKKSYSKMKRTLIYDYYCTLYRKLYKLEEHKTINQINEIFRCRKCGKRLLNKSQKKIHYRYEHATPKVIENAEKMGLILSNWSFTQDHFLPISIFINDKEFVVDPFQFKTFEEIYESGFRDEVIKEYEIRMRVVFVHPIKIDSDRTKRKRVNSPDHNKEINEDCELDVFSSRLREEIRTLAPKRRRKNVNYRV